MDMTNRGVVLFGLVTTLFILGCSEGESTGLNWSGVDIRRMSEQGEKAMLKIDGARSLFASDQPVVQYSSEVLQAIQSVSNVTERFVLIGRYEKFVATLKVPIGEMTNSVQLGQLLLSVRDLDEATLQMSYKIRNSRLGCVGFTLDVVERFNAMIALLEDMLQDSGLRKSSKQADELRLCVRSIKNARAMWISRHIDSGGYLERDFHRAEPALQQQLLRDMTKVLGRSPAWMQPKHREKTK